MADTYDVVVIGSGPGGYVTAIKAAQAGLKTAIVEKDKRLGGTCTLVGCIPTKALLRSAEVMDLMAEAKRFGVDVNNYALNFLQAYKFKEDIVTKNSAGIDFLMRKNKIVVHKGLGRIAGKGKVEVKADDGKTETLETKNIIIATGSVPKTLPGIEPDHKLITTSDSILRLETMPKTMVVLGAGAVGMEFASVFTSFGAKVTVVEYLPRLLPIEDDECSEEIQKAYRKRKIDFLVDTKVERVEKTGQGVKVHVKDNKTGAAQVLEAEMLLSAVGRSPFVEGLGLEKTAVKVERGFVQVDTMFRTAEPNVYAIGDVVSVNGQPHPMLAHVASYEGAVAVEHIAGKNPQPVNYDQIPSATYCWPEVASVGLTERKAKERGYEVRTGKFPFSALGKARIVGESWGFVKIVADKKYDEVLGIHLVGPHATELLAEACLGLRLETTVEEIEKTMHAHPTLSEAVLEAAHVAMGHPLHM
jgi:dihydrolipoamide dehydrogenase